MMNKLFRSGPPLLIGSMLCVYWIIGFSQLTKAQEQYQAPSNSELGRESARQGRQMDNMGLTVTQLGLAQARTQAQLDQVIEGQASINKKLDAQGDKFETFFWAVLAMSLKMLFDLSKDLLFMRRSKASGGA